MLRKLETRLSGWAIEHLALYLVFGQVFMLTLLWFTPLTEAAVVLSPQRVLEGEVWRLLTFMLVPPLTSPSVGLGLIFMVFGWYLFWLMSGFLESHWGVVRFNLFLFIGWFATVVGSFFFPSGLFEASALYTSVFLAFAYLNPNFEILLFFILPVKIKWLALITWGFFAFIAVTGGWSATLMIAAATLNFFLFFGRDLLGRAKSGRWKMQRQVEEIKSAGQPFHTCSVCGATDISHPDRQFFYDKGVCICEVCAREAQEAAQTAKG